MVKIILTGKNLIQLNFKVNIHITYNALTLILFIVLRMLIINDLSVELQSPSKMNFLFDFAFYLSCLLLPYYF